MGDNNNLATIHPKETVKTERAKKAKPPAADASPAAKASDTPQDRLAKLLPADVTAAFLSAKVALVASSGENVATYVFWTFVIIAFLCPFYFRYVTRVRSRLHITFLTASFVVFAFSIAETEFAAYFKDVIDRAPIRAAAIVLPILWTYMVTQISVAALDYKNEARDEHA